jgi:hypothetical protein
MSLKVNVNEESLKKIQSEVRVALEKIISNPKLKTDIGEAIIKDIQFETRKGNSIPNRGKLKPLSSSWKKMRERIGQSNPTHPTFQKSRSNLTISGKLLDSMIVNLKPRGSFEVDFDGDHEPYKVKKKTLWTVKSHKRLLSGTGLTAETSSVTRVKKHVRTASEGTFEIGKKIPNKLLADYVARTRPFMGIRPIMEQRSKQKVIDYLRRSSQFFRSMVK